MKLTKKLKEMIDFEILNRNLKVTYSIPAQESVNVTFTDNDKLIKKYVLTDSEHLKFVDYCDGNVCNW